MKASLEIIAYLRDGENADPYTGTMKLTLVKATFGNLSGAMKAVDKLVEAFPKDAADNHVETSYPG